MSTAKQDHFNIFYSWQSDLDKKSNNHFIKDCIDKAITELKREATIWVIPRLDKDTEGVSGSPKIVDSILNKIDASQIFIADITLINSTRVNRFMKTRLTPNPNVLFELGYGLNRLTWDRIICLNNSAFSNIKDMPFDLQQNRIAQYCFSNKRDHKKKNEAKKELTGLLKTAIKSIIDKKEILLSKGEEGNRNLHDINIFKGLDVLIDDINFLSLLNHINSYYSLSSKDYRLFDSLVEYLRAERNKFLNGELSDRAQNLATSIESMHLTLAASLHSRENTTAEDVENNDILYVLLKNEYGFKDHEEYSKDRNVRIERIEMAVSDLIETYKDFRAAIKSHFFI